ncbi:hypothetical protein [Priestia megaterium]|uniref:hypothetical protein n=1 Tax=Priestia megaterium TaxID=1404 RepID=UPI003CC61510
MFTAKDKKKEIVSWLKIALIFLVFFIAPIALTFFFMMEKDTTGAIAWFILCIIMAKIGLAIIDAIED